MGFDLNLYTFCCVNSYITYIYYIYISYTYYAYYPYACRAFFICTHAHTHYRHIYANLYTRIFIEEKDIVKEFQFIMYGSKNSADVRLVDGERKQEDYKPGLS